MIFVDPYCQHGDGDGDCLEPAVRVVGNELLCQGHATLADLRRAGIGRALTAEERAAGQAGKGERR